MANIKSQIKRIKTNKKRQDRNKAVKSGLKTASRKFLAAFEGQQVDEARVEFRAASRLYAKAASKGVIHKNQAANKTSAMAKKFNTLEAAGGR